MKARLCLLLLAALLGAASAADFKTCLAAGANAIAKDSGLSLPGANIDPWNAGAGAFVRVSKFTNVQKSPPRPVFGFQLKETNRDCELTNTQHLSRTAEHVNTYSSSLTTSLHLGMSLSFDVSVPLVEGVKTTIDFSMDVSQTTEETKQDTTAFTWSEDIGVSPRTAKVIKASINEVEFAAEYDYLVTFTGDVEVDFGGRKARIPVADLLDRALAAGEPACEGFVAGQSTFRGKGLVSGGVGTDMVVDIFVNKLKPCDAPKPALLNAAASDADETIEEGSQPVESMTVQPAA